MKRLIYSSSDQTSVTGFLFEFGNRAIFLESSSSNITTKIVKSMINAVCDYRNIPGNSEIRQSALSDISTLNDFRRRISKASLEHIVTDSVDYYRISGRGFNISLPKEDFENEVILLEE